MSLDTRARHAVRSLQESVVRVTPMPLPSVSRRHRSSLLAGLIGALAIAFGSIALAAMLPDGPADDAATVTSLIPDPEIDGELVVMPDGGYAIEGIHQKNSSSTAVEPYTQFYGAADPGTVITAFSPYGAADTVVGESGEFSLKLYFEGAPSGVTFPVTLTVGDTEYDFEFTWLWDPQNIEISAHQGYGESDSPVPFEKFFGTAPPGTHVEIVSPYGSAETESGDGGEWFAKVWFEGQAMGEAFPIQVTVGDQTFDFSFLWTFDGIIEITVHQEGTSSSSSSPYTRFIGTAPEGTVILATSAYGSADMVVGESGEFSLKVWFNDPPKGVTFPITVKFDGETYDGEFHFTSYYEPGPVEFTLHQVNTVSDSPTPYVKFQGTATAGTTIGLYSPYGSTDMTVEETGEWLLKLWFSPLPPAGEQFQVSVKVNGSYYGTFYFTSYHDGSGVTVVQHNFESESPEPYVKFYGTAPAGTEISAYSSYGSKEITVGETGTYELKLFFDPLPPAGEQFQIGVKVNGAFHGNYYFTSWYEAGSDVTVNQWNTATDSPTPFVKFYGTAPAGTQISAYSSYGEASVTVGEGGSYTLYVYLQDPPYEEAILVAVKVDGAFHGNYYITVYPPG